MWKLHYGHVIMWYLMCKSFSPTTSRPTIRLQSGNGYAPPIEARPAGLPSWPSAAKSGGEAGQLSNKCLNESGNPKWWFSFLVSLSNKHKMGTLQKRHAQMKVTETRRHTIWLLRKFKAPTPFSKTSKARTPSEHPHYNKNGWCTYPKMAPFVLTHRHVDLMNLEHPEVGSEGHAAA